MKNNMCFSNSTKRLFLIIAMLNMPTAVVSQTGIEESAKDLAKQISDNMI